MVDSPQRLLFAACLFLVANITTGGLQASEEPCPPSTQTGHPTAPVATHKVAAEYSAAALAARVQGVVILRTAIRADGTVSDIEVLKGLPLGLTEQAIEAVQQRLFEPATFCGKAVDVSFNQTVWFELPAVESASTLDAEAIEAGSTAKNNWRASAVFAGIVTLLMAAGFVVLLGVLRTTRGMGK